MSAQPAHGSQVDRWRSIIENSAPRAAVEDQQRGLVWRHAATGVDEDLDVDAACAVGRRWPALRGAMVARPDYTALRYNPALAQYLTELNAPIAV